MMMWKIVVLLVTIEVLEVGLSTLIKASSTKGMSNYVFAVYSNAFAVPPLLLITFFYYRFMQDQLMSIMTRYKADIYEHIEIYHVLLFTPYMLTTFRGQVKEVRRKLDFKCGSDVVWAVMNWPSRYQLKWSTFIKIFLITPLGTFAQLCKYTGASLSGPTLYSAILDLIPAFAFIIAIISRMEVVRLKDASTKAKSIGTIVSVAGALVATLYKGMPLITPASTSTSEPSFSVEKDYHDYDHQISSPSSNWILGGVLLTITSFLTAACYIIQAWILRAYPEPLVFTLLCLVFNTIASTLFAIFVEKDPAVWILRPDLELITILYQVVFMLGFRDIVHSWAVGNKGPVFVSMFKPLQLVFAVFMGFLFLGDAICLGSVIGASIIAAGFYSIMWGKAQEEKMHEAIQLSDDDIHSSYEKMPLMLSPTSPIITSISSSSLRSELGNPPFAAATSTQPQVRLRQLHNHRQP